MAFDEAARSLTTMGALSRRRRRPIPLFGYLCVLPALVFAAIFLLYPALSAIYHSFTDWDGANQSNFVGLGNFQQMLSDPEMSRSFLNLLIVIVFSLVVELTIPLAVAKMILSLRANRLQNIFRVLFLLPLIVPQVVIYLVWEFIYDPDPSVGLLNASLQLFNPSAQPQAWLGDHNLALYAILATGAGIVASFPFVDGFGLLIYTAGLHAIPKEITESAQLDGSNGWSSFWRIELPLILGQLRLMTILTIIAAVQQYTAVLILTNGGPGDATNVPGFTMFHNAFYYNHKGYACAIGVVLFLLILVLTVVNLRHVRPATDFEVRGAS
jgi:raffinose/stachyose/melibiose transport system permease protein